MRALIKELERLSVDSPKEAIRRSEQLISGAPRELLPQLCGICGTAYRRVSELDKAFFVLYEGLSIARQEKNLDAEARLLQRMAYVFGDRGEFERSLETAETATSKFVSAGNPRGAAKALFDQGQWHYYLGHFDSSVTVCKSAFRVLPRDEIANRFAALQTIGLCFLELEDIRRSVRYARLARSFKDLVGSALWSKQLWLEAKILARKGDIRLAEQRLNEALHIYLKIEAFLDAALICTEITQLALRSGDLRRTSEIAASFRIFLVTTPRLADNKIAAGAMMDIVRSAAAGENLEEVVQRVKVRLERAKTRPRLRY